MSITALESVSSVAKRLRSRARIGPPLLGVLLVIVAADVSLQSEFTQARSAPSRKNIVVIMTDDQTADSLPVMRKMMAFPDGSWVNFKNAFINASICCPSRASFLVGQYSHETGVISNGDGNKLNDRNTLAVWLNQAGYNTALIGKYLNGYPWGRGSGYVPPGWDYFRTSTGDTDNHSTLAVNFLKTAQEPYFLWQTYRAPHSPAAPKVPSRYQNASVYVPPEPANMNESDVSDKPAWVRNLSLLSTSQLSAQRAERVASQRALLAVDDGVKQIFDTVKSRGQLNNTVFVYTTDHGYSFGSHRHIGKFCVYEECSRVPLVIRYPGVVGNREESRLVSNIDLTATLADIAGAIPGVAQSGRSFVPLLTGTATSWPNEVLLERLTAQNRRFYGIRVPGWVYAEYFNGEKELYDLAADPYQLQNRARQAAYAAKQSELAQRLQALKAN
jgi:N-acetylglucosamine-6-sulfatase